MECPKCSRSLANSARYCGCGWKRDNNMATTGAHIQCAFDGCNTSAMVKKQTPTGWAKLCYFHSDQLRMEEAYANLDKWGMERLPDETQAEWSQRMRQFVVGGFKRFQHRKAA